jgi:hypothetical protein
MSEVNFETKADRLTVIRRVLFGFADVEFTAAAGLARAVRAAGRACWAGRWRVIWAAVKAVATVVMLAAAVSLAASVAVVGG